MSVFVAPLDTSHISAVAEIERLCFAEPWSAASLTLLTTPQGGGFVALSEGSVVGYVGFLVVLDELEITNVAVHPDSRRLGVGAALLSTLIAHASEQNASRITLDVRESNLPALSLYQKFHFSPCGLRKNFYSSPRENAIVMEWLGGVEETNGKVGE